MHAANFCLLRIRSCSPDLTFKLIIILPVKHISHSKTIFVKAKKLSMILNLTIKDENPLTTFKDTMHLSDRREQTEVQKLQRSASLYQP